MGERVSGCTASAISATLNGFRCARYQVTCDSVWQQQAAGNKQQATGSNSNSNNYIASCQVRPGGGIVHTDYTDNNVGLLAMTAKDALWLWPLGTEESRCYLSTRQVARVSNLL